jgi:hypothetical protein
LLERKKTRPHQQLREEERRKHFAAELLGAETRNNYGSR